MEELKRWLYGAKMSLSGWQTVDEQALAKKLQEFNLGHMKKIKIRTDRWKRTWCKCIML